MAKRCNVCDKPFKNARGVNTHKIRSEACGGVKVTWGSTKGRKKAGPKLGRNGESGREAIQQILSNHPQGLPLPQILAELQQRGIKVRHNYISQTAANDPSIVRVERGVYRLKKNALSAQAGTTVVKEAVAEATGMTRMPVEALLLRIETLETQNRALQEAHITFVRGALA